MLRATAVYLFLGFYIAIFAPFGILWAFVTANPHLLYVLARSGIRAAGWLSGVRVRTQGLEKVFPGQAYVFLSNHLGNFDGPLLSHVIPRDCRGLVKQEMMHLPILSRVLKQAQFVPIERLDPRKARKGIELGAKLLREGKSFFAFPEGTRSRDGRLGDFKKGVFIMAIQAQSPIVPVTIVGTNQIQRPGKYAIRPGTICVTFHEPISTEGMGLENRNQLIQRTRDAIASALPAQ